jgi:hypothetical protein
MNFITEQSIQKLIPSIRWHQTSTHVFIFFDVHNIDKNNIINIESNKIYFNVMSNNNNYNIELHLYDSVIVEESNYVIDEKCVKFTLTKSNDNNLSWNSLLKDKNMYKNNIKVNWQNWDDSDDEEDNQQNMNLGGNQQFDFHKMMESMGGIGGMGDMLKNMNGMENNQLNDNEDNEDNEDIDENEEYNENEDNNKHGENEEEYCYDCN